jgi:hypothetical protein
MKHRFPQFVHKRFLAYFRPPFIRKYNGAAILCQLFSQYAREQPG